MGLKFNKGKALVTIQDMGRRGYQSQGVPVSGAMDDDSLFQANALVGNNRFDAGLEIGIGEVEFEFDSASILAVSGTAHRLLLDDIEVALNKSIYVARGSRVKLIPGSEGLWSYLAVGGGLDVPPVLGSRSTYLPAGFGGLEGRPLCAGDRLSFGKKTRLTEAIIDTLLSGAVANWWIAGTSADQSRIRMAPGPEWNWLSEGQQRQLLGQTFRVSLDTNRMGYRLAGDPISRLSDQEMISSGVARGTVQLTNDGSLIVLMADSQTVGGYPRIGQVAAVDVPDLAQKRAGKTTGFSLISQDEAERLFLIREQERRQITEGIRLKFGR